MRIKAARSKHLVNLTLQQNRKITFHKYENSVHVCSCPGNSYALPHNIYSLLTTVKLVKTLNWTQKRKKSVIKKQSPSPTKLCVWSHFPPLQSCSPVLRKGFKISIPFCHATVKTTYRLLHWEEKEGNCSQKPLPDPETLIFVHECASKASQLSTNILIKFFNSDASTKDTHTLYSFKNT